MAKLTGEQKAEALWHAVGLIQKGEIAVSAWGACAKKYGLHPSTLYNWYKKVRDKPPEEWPVLLEPQYKGRTAFAAISNEAWEFFLAGCVEDSQSIFDAHYETVRQGQKKGWDVPSVRTFQRKMVREGIKTWRYAAMGQEAWIFFLTAYNGADIPLPISAAHSATVRQGEKKGWLVPSVEAFRARMKREEVKKRSMYDHIKL